jgi:hypothetical protein
VGVNSLPYKLAAYGLLLTALSGAGSWASPGQVGQWDVTGLDQLEGPVALQEGQTYHLDLIGCVPKGVTVTFTVNVTAVPSGRVEASAAQSYSYARLSKGGCASSRLAAIFTAAEGGPHVLEWVGSPSLVSLRPTFVLKQEWLPWPLCALMLVGGLGGAIGVGVAYARADALSRLPKEVGLKRFGAAADARPASGKAGAAGMATAREAQAPPTGGPPVLAEALWTFTDLRGFGDTRVASDGARLCTVAEPVVFGPGDPALVSFSLAGQVLSEVRRESLGVEGRLTSNPRRLAVGTERGLVVVRWGYEAVAMDRTGALRWRYRPPAASKLRIVSIAAAAGGNLTVVASDQLVGLNESGATRWEAPFAGTAPVVSMPADGRYVAVASGAKELEFLSPDGKPLRNARTTLEVKSVDVSRDGSRVLVFMGTAWIAMFDEEGKELWRASTHARPRLAAMPADGSFVIVVNASAQILCFDAEGKEISSDEGAAGITGLDVSPDGELVFLARRHELMAVRLQR